MCSLNHAYHENSSFLDPYETTWKEFKSSILCKMEKLRNYREEHERSKIAQEEVEKRENEFKIFMSLVSLQDEDANMAMIRAALQREHVQNRESKYYQKNWILAIISTGGKLLELSNTNMKLVQQEEKAIELGLPKYEQPSLFD